MEKRDRAVELGLRRGRARGLKMHDAELFRRRHAVRMILRADRGRTKD
jgi:hypothetical protein